MRSVEELLNSGEIISGLTRTIQTQFSEVYSFHYRYYDDGNHMFIHGYVQIRNTNKNAIINGEPIHAFDCIIGKVDEENYE